MRWKGHFHSHARNQFSQSKTMGNGSERHVKPNLHWLDHLLVGSCSCGAHSGIACSCLSAESSVAQPSIKYCSTRSDRGCVARDLRIITRKVYARSRSMARWGSCVPVVDMEPQPLRRKSVKSWDGSLWDFPVHIVKNMDQRKLVFLAPRKLFSFDFTFKDKIKAISLKWHSSAGSTEEARSINPTRPMTLDDCSHRLI